MALTSKQRKKLRGMANTMDPVLIIGKNDINEGVVQQTEDALEAHELIKGSVLETSDLTAREACDELVRRTGAEPIQVIGRKFVLYRETHRDDVKKISID